jgi:hypothetical protein
MRSSEGLSFIFERSSDVSVEECRFEKNTPRVQAEKRHGETQRNSSHTSDMDRFDRETELAN